ncbi:MAG: hypothetical protein ABSH20_16850 [Tepidisphaeraceae bacterium]
MAALAGGLILLGAVQVKGDAITGNEDGKFISKTGTLDERVLLNQPATGTVTTIFNFHPLKTVDTPIAKNFNPPPPTVKPNPVVVNYPGAEEHGTTGKVTTTNTIRPVIIEGNPRKTGYLMGGEYKAEIIPGTTTPPKLVSVTVNVKDPIAFSNDDASGAPFYFAPGGLDYSFSLLQDTAFPLGQDASGSMTFDARVAPGVISDPDSFWGQPHRCD